MMSRFLIALVAYAVLPAWCLADTVTLRRGPATLQLTTPTRGKTLALADLLTVTLTVDTADPPDVDAPLKMPDDSPWLLVKRTRPTVERLPNERARWRITYEFAPREPGQLAFAFPAVRAGADEGAAWEVVIVDVTASVADPASAKLRDITGVETIEDATPPRSPFSIAWPIGCIAFLFCLAGVLLLMRRKRQLHRSAEQIALYELARLEGMNLVESGRAIQFAALLTTLIRRYLERAYQLPARRRTTAEFDEMVRDSTLLSDDEKAILRLFFQAADVIKYGAQAPTAGQCADWITSTKALLTARIDAAKNAAAR